MPKTVALLDLKARWLSLFYLLFLMLQKNGDFAFGKPAFAKAECPPMAGYGGRGKTPRLSHVEIAKQFLSWRATPLLEGNCKTRLTTPKENQNFEYLESK